MKLRINSAEYRALPNKSLFTKNGNMYEANLTRNQMNVILPKITAYRMRKPIQGMFSAWKKRTSVSPTLYNNMTRRVSVKPITRTRVLESVHKYAKMRNFEKTLFKRYTGIPHRTFIKKVASPLATEFLQFKKSRKVTKPQVDRITRLLVRYKGVNNKVPSFMKEKVALPVKSFINTARTIKNRTRKQTAAAKVIQRRFMNPSYAMWKNRTFVLNTPWAKMTLPQRIRVLQGEPRLK
jgi:hypothetical protein